MLETFVSRRSSSVCVNVCLISSFTTDPQEKMPPSKTWKRMWYGEFKKPKRDAEHQYLSNENVEGTYEVFVPSAYKATRVVNCVPDCVSTNHSSYGSFCGGGGVHGDWTGGLHALVRTQCAAVQRLLNIYRELSETLRFSVTDDVQTIYPSLSVRLLYASNIVKLICIHTVPPSDEGNILRFRNVLYIRFAEEVYSFRYNVINFLPGLCRHPLPVFMFCFTNYKVVKSSQLCWCRFNVMITITLCVCKQWF
jgi:hypothetical protein